MHSYNPSNIRCGDVRRPGFPDGCSSMTNLMTASQGDLVFGKAGQPGVQEHLPTNFITPGE